MNRPGSCASFTVVVSSFLWSSVVSSGFMVPAKKPPLLRRVEVPSGGQRG